MDRSYSSLVVLVDTRHYTGLHGQGLGYSSTVFLADRSSWTSIRRKKTAYRTAAYYRKWKYSPWVDQYEEKQHYRILSLSWSIWGKTALQNTFLEEINKGEKIIKKYFFLELFNAVCSKENTRTDYFPWVAKISVQNRTFSLIWYIIGKNISTKQDIFPELIYYRKKDQYRTGHFPWADIL